MTHVYHEGLPGYDKDQVLHDGCEECEHRSRDVARAIGHMDKHIFARAWTRASTLNRAGLDNVSTAEFPVLKALWAVQCQLENRGVPIGRIPGANPVRFPGPGATL